MVHHYKNGRQLLICLVGILVIDSLRGATEDECLQTHTEAVAKAANDSVEVYCPLIEAYGKCLIQVKDNSDRKDLAEYLRPIINNQDRGTKCRPWNINQWIVDVLPGNRILGLYGSYTADQYAGWQDCLMDRLRSCSEVEDEMICRLRALDLENILKNDTRYNQVSFIMSERAKTINPGYTCAFNMPELFDRAQASGSSQVYGSIMTIFSLIIVAMCHW